MNRKLFLAVLFVFPMSLNAQVKEKIDRGIVALTVSEKAVFVSWRLLKDDPGNVAFNIYRKDIGLGDFVKVNKEPVANSTNFLDETVTGGHGYNYRVKTIVNSRESETPGEAYVFTLDANQPWVSIKLKDEIVLKRIGIGDLDGDGEIGRASWRERV